MVLLRSFDDTIECTYTSTMANIPNHRAIPEGYTQSLCTRGCFGREQVTPKSHAVRCGSGHKRYCGQMIEHVRVERFGYSVLASTRSRRNNGTAMQKHVWTALWKPEETKEGYKGNVACRRHDKKSASAKQLCGLILRRANSSLPKTDCQEV